jgi:hypothetical protein
MGGKNQDDKQESMTGRSHSRELLNKIKWVQTTQAACGPVKRARNPPSPSPLAPGLVPPVE